MRIRSTQSNIYPSCYRNKFFFRYRHRHRYRFMMKAQTILTFFLIKQFYCYVYDEKYPIILSTSQDLSELQGVTLDTDHFGFNLDLDVGSKHLWVGAPKGASPSNDNEVPGTLHTCDLNIRNPGSCKILPDTAVSGNEDVNGQLYGISVNTVNSKARGTTEVDI